MHIVVEKSLRRLTLFDGESVKAQFPIALGKNPVGHKEKEGDNRTPEGGYYVCIRNSESKFYRSLGLNYPSYGDALAAFHRGEITADVLSAIRLAEEERRHPPFDTPLGGSIFIHGGGCIGDWTAGCIAVENDAMDLLFMTCPLGTEVTILP